MRQLEDGIYKLSNTDKKRIMAHARAIAADRTRNHQYDGYIEAWFDTDTGKVIYREVVGNGYTKADDGMEFIYSAQCYR